MITAKDINNIIGIKESYELPDRLMTLLLDKNECERIFLEFLKLEQDLSFDWFTNYFQEQHSNRDNMMQDYTPKELCELITKLEPNYNSVADVCCGTGGLTIGAWNKNHNAFFYCEELSTRAFPLLLFNLAIRKMNAIAVNKDVLKNEVYKIYRIQNGEITEIEDVPTIEKADIVISNPPYSVKYKYDDKNIDKRFIYGNPPNNASDYGFVMHCMSLVKNSGKIIAILPHGVLFRGNKEGIIRKKIIEDNKLSAVIGMPDKLFLNTGIPVAVIVYGNSDNVLFIDASKEFEKGSKQNRLSEENIIKIIDTYKYRKEIEKYSHIANIKEIEENDYNLNIPRYVDNFEKEEEVDIENVINEIVEINREINYTEKQLLGYTEQLVAEDIKEKNAIAKMMRMWRELINEKPEQIRFDI